MNVVSTLKVDKQNTSLACVFRQGVFRKDLLLALVVGVVPTLADQLDVL